jgi:hypothetical protein
MGPYLTHLVHYLRNCTTLHRKTRLQAGFYFIALYPLLAEPGTKQHLKTSLIEFCFLAESGHSLKEGDLSCLRPKGAICMVGY